MTKIVYYDEKQEKGLKKKYSRMFPLVTLDLKIRPFDLSEEEPFKKTAESLQDLIEFYEFIRTCVHELLICLSLLEKFEGAELDKKNSQANIAFSAILFFLYLYFHDFINRVYIFDQKCSKLIRDCQELNIEKIRALREKKEYVKVQNKFRLNYTHYSKIIRVYRSLFSKEFIFTYEKSSELEVYKPKYFKNLTERSFETVTQIIKNLVEEYNQTADLLIKEKKLIIAEYKNTTGRIIKDGKRAVLKKGRTWTKVKLSKSRIIL